MRRSDGTRAASIIARPQQEPPARAAALPPLPAHQRPSFTQPHHFDERIYLDTYPDVQLAVEIGDLATAEEHYRLHGLAEGRATSEDYIYALGHGPQGAAPSAGLTLRLDTVVVAESGLALLVGWLDDRESRLHSLSVFLADGQGWTCTAFGRVRRGDVEAALGAPPGHSFGFWAVVRLEPGAQADLRRPWTARARLANGRWGELPATPHITPDQEARNVILGYLAAAEHYGNRDVESFIALDQGVGEDLVAFNRRISASITARPHVVYHGPNRRHFKGSLIVCLYGRPEFMFLQNALFRPAPGAEDYEYIYVSNSPEMTETLDKFARIGARVYGLSTAVVTLSGNAGFSAANNVAARFARSDRITIVNPDVFPRDTGWAARHTAIIEGLPKAQTAMFGAPLYYDDGSLMHGGMYFEPDRGLSIRPAEITARTMVRVEHYGKGAPAWSDRYARARPVPAVTGAFISADRAWFEKLGGFSEDYLFGHYEDADLCLKSLAAGQPVWLQDVRFWHMEGKGSTRLPVHEGGSLVNRWWFSRTWGDMIEAGLSGPEPVHPLLAAPPRSEAPTRPAARRPRRG